MITSKNIFLIIFVTLFSIDKSQLFALNPKPAPQEYLASKDFKIALQTAQKEATHLLWDDKSQQLSAEDLSALTSQTINYGVFEITEKYQKRDTYITLIAGASEKQVFPKTKKAIIENLDLKQNLQSVLDKAQETGSNIVVLNSKNVAENDIKQTIPVTINAVIEWLQNHPASTIKEIRFLTDDQYYAYYAQIVGAITQKPDSPLECLPFQAKETCLFIKYHHLAESSAKPQPASFGGKPPLVFVVHPKKQ
jgi:hypothetical protein